MAETTPFCFKKIGVVCDHAGKDLKDFIAKSLGSFGLSVIDYGFSGDSTTKVDYPDFAHKLASAVSKQEVEAGIAVCGTGIGMSIVANKHPNVRAACIWDEYSCQMSREHNNTNILCLGGRTLNPQQALKLVELWLRTPFAGAQHAVRIEKIDKLEKKLFNPLHS